LRASVSFATDAFIQVKTNFLNVASMLATRHQLYQDLSVNPRFASDKYIRQIDIILQLSITADLRITFDAVGA
jgi:hypothetical protein